MFKLFNLKKTDKLIAQVAKERLQTLKQTLLSGRPIEFTKTPGLETVQQILIDPTDGLIKVLVRVSPEEAEHLLEAHAKKLAENDPFIVTHYFGHDHVLKNAEGYSGQVSVDNALDILQEVKT